MIWSLEMFEKEQTVWIQGFLSNMSSLVNSKFCETKVQTRQDFIYEKSISWRDRPTLYTKFFMKVCRNKTFGIYKLLKTGGQNITWK